MTDPDDILDEASRLASTHDGETITDLLEACEEIFLHGFADDQGRVGSDEYVYRVDHWLVWCDSQGFSTLDEYASEAAAEQAMDRATQD